MIDTNIIILGAGGFAREVFYHLIDIRKEIGWHKGNVFFVDDVSGIKELLHQPVIKNWKFPENSMFTVGVGDPELKKILVKKAIDAGLGPLGTLIHPRALVQDASFIGLGGIICPGAVITTNVSIGDYVTINPNCTVGHDTIIGDYSNLSPGCNISGNNTIGKSCSFGTGTATKEKLTITDNVITGAQAGVVKNITESGIHVGVPAKKIK